MSAQIVLEEVLYVPPISVCFTVGCSSAYKHIRRRSASVKVFLGVVVLDLSEVADDGVADTAETGVDAGATATGAEG